MTVKSGSQSSIQYQGSEIRGRSWTLNVNRETRDITCSNRLRKKYRAGRRTTTGQVQLLYDSDDTAAIDMLNAVDTTEQQPTTLKLIQAEALTEYEIDSYYENVNYLLRFNDGDGSVVFKDDSLNNATTTAYGNARVIPDYLNLDGNGDYTNTYDALIPATADFTAECYVFLYEVGRWHSIFGQWAEKQSADKFALQVTAANQLRLFFDGSTITSAATLLDSTLYHVALTRRNDVFTIWLNGAAVAGGIISSPIPQAYGLRIGAISNSSTGSPTGSHRDYYHGSIDSVRITPNVVRYAGPFTPPPFLEDPYFALPGTPRVSTEQALSVEALFTRRSITAQVGNAYAVTLGFQATGPVTGVF